MSSGTEGLYPVSAGDQFSVRTTSSFDNNGKILTNMLRLAGAAAIAYQSDEIITKRSGKSVSTNANNKWIIPLGAGLILSSSEISAHLKKTQHYAIYTLYDRKLNIVQTGTQVFNQSTLKQNGGIVLAGTAMVDGYLQIKILEDTIITGTSGSVTPVYLSSGETTIVASVHTHPSYGLSTIDPGDFYFTLSANKANSSYTTSYVLGSDGAVYALTVTNAAAAQAFLAANPNNSSNTSGGLFAPGSILYDPYNDALNAYLAQGMSENAANQNALAYVLSNYDTGISMLKGNSVSQPLNTLYGDIID